MTIYYIAENGGKETFVTAMSKSGAIFLLRHFNILSASGECLCSPNSIIIAIISISLPHFGHAEKFVGYLSGLALFPYFARPPTL